MKTIAVALAFAAGHSLPAPGPDSSRAESQEIVQRFICERSYTNYAWGYQHGGIVVDNAGRVHRFEVRGRAPLGSSSTDGLTDPEMEVRFGPDRTLLRTVPTDELVAMFRLIPAAAKGRFSDRVSASRDRGAFVNACYLFDAAAKRYRKVELDVTGDWEYRNLAPEAKKLAAWLASLDRRPQEKK